jgi:hypothetical protein
MARVISLSNEVSLQLDRIKLAMEKENNDDENIPYGIVVKKIIKRAGMWEKKKKRKHED